MDWQKAYGAWRHGRLTSEHKPGTIRKMRRKNICSCAELIDYVNEIGFLPLLDMGIAGWSAQSAVAEEYQYTVLPDGGWEWPLWEWKGEVVRESGCAYGKLILQKAAFVSRECWPDLCNCRRSTHPRPEAGSVEDTILEVLSQGGSMVSNDLRQTCGFTEPKMRGKFDTFLSHLQRGGYIVTEDFVYKHDKHGRKYGWGLSLFTTPEQLFGREACHPDRPAEESYQRLAKVLQKIFPDASDVFLENIIYDKPLR